MITKPTRAIGQIWRHTVPRDTNDWQIVAGDKITGWTINQLKDGAQTTNYPDACFPEQYWDFVRDDKPIESKPPRAIGQIWKLINTGEKWIIIGDACKVVKSWKLKSQGSGNICDSYDDSVIEGSQWEFVGVSEPAIGQVWHHHVTEYTVTDRIDGTGSIYWTVRRAKYPELMNIKSEDFQNLDWKLKKDSKKIFVGQKWNGVEVLTVDRASNSFTFNALTVRTTYPISEFEKILNGMESKKYSMWKPVSDCDRGSTLEAERRVQSLGPFLEKEKKEKEVRLMIENLKFKDVVIHPILHSMMSAEMAELFGYEIREDGDRKLLFRPGKLVSGIPVSELTTLFKKEIEGGNIAVTEFAIRTGLLAEARVEAII